MSTRSARIALSRNLPNRTREPFEAPRGVLVKERGKSGSLAGQLRLCTFRNWQ